MPTQDFVSFIVPFYNAEQYISKCVDCILRQTYPHWELLLIDDGSKDQSASISDQCATSDNRIRVIHQENRGVSVARNIGLAQAKGKWIAFIDVDDIIEPQYLEHLLVETDQPLIVGGFKRFGEIEDESLPSKSGVCVIKDELQELWERSLKGFIFWYVWGKLFRKDIIEENHLTFQKEMIYNEDNCFVLNYLCNIKSFEFVQHADYLHFFEKRGSKKYLMNYDVFNTHFQLQEKAFEQLENKNNHKYSKVRLSVYRRFFTRYLCYIYTTNNFEAYKENLKDFKRKYLWITKDAQLIPSKIAITLTFHLPYFIGYSLQKYLLTKILR